MNKSDPVSVLPADKRKISCGYDQVVRSSIKRDGSNLGRGAINQKLSAGSPVERLDAGIKRKLQLVKTAMRPSRYIAQDDPMEKVAAQIVQVTDVISSRRTARAVRRGAGHVKIESISRARGVAGRDTLGVARAELGADGVFTDALQAGGKSNAPAARPA